MVVSWLLVQDNSADPTFPASDTDISPSLHPPPPLECAKWCWCDNAIVVKSAANVPRLPWSTLITIYKHLQTKQQTFSNIAANNINENRILKFCFTGHLSHVVYLAHKLKLNLVQKYFLFFPTNLWVGRWDYFIFTQNPSQRSSHRILIYFYLLLLQLNVCRWDQDNLGLKIAQSG